MAVMITNNPIIAISCGVRSLKSIFIVSPYFSIDVKSRCFHSNTQSLRTLLINLRIDFSIDMRFKRILNSF